MRNIAEHENFSINKYENANYCWAWKSFITLTSEPRCSKVNAYVYANFDQIQSIRHKILSGNEIFTIFKGHNCVV